MTADSKKLTTSRPLSALERFFFYGLHGLFDEIVFTAIFDLIFEPEGNIQLKGYSTIFSFFIYGSCSFFVERCYVYLHRQGVPAFLRSVLYLFILYTWELSSGLILRQFNACSWDYSHYKYNFMGLITLEYAPVWFAMCFYQDILSRFLLNITVNFHTQHEKSN